MNITVNGLSFEKEFAPFLEKLTTVLHQHQIKIFLSPTFLIAFFNAGAKASDFAIITSKEQLSTMDFVISVGGDGTLLDTVSYVGAYEIPMIGINTGRMGF